MPVTYSIPASLCDRCDEEGTVHALTEPTGFRVWLCARCGTAVAKEILHRGSAAGRAAPEDKATQDARYFLHLRAKAVQLEPWARHVIQLHKIRISASLSEIRPGGGRSTPLRPAAGVVLPVIPGGNRP